MSWFCKVIGVLFFLVGLVLALSNEADFAGIDGEIALFAGLFFYALGEVVSGGWPDFSK